MTIGKRESRQMLTDVRRLWGQFSTGPSGVRDQSFARIRAPVSPPPTRKPESGIVILDGTTGGTPEGCTIRTRPQYKVFTVLRRPRLLHFSAIATKFRPTPFASARNAGKWFFAISLSIRYTCCGLNLGNGDAHSGLPTLDICRRFDNSLYVPTLKTSCSRPPRFLLLRKPKTKILQVSDIRDRTELYSLKPSGRESPTQIFPKRGCS